MNPRSFQNELKLQVNNRIHFANIAILAVWIGGGIGILAACSKIFTGGSVDMTILVVSLIAIFLSIPVAMERKNLKALLETFD